MKIELFFINHFFIKTRTPYEKKQQKQMKLKKNLLYEKKMVTCKKLFERILLI